MNPYKRLAQEEKAKALVAVIDAHLSAGKGAIDPYAQAGDVAGGLLCWSKKQWGMIALEALVNPPSIEVIELVFETYRARHLANQSIRRSA